MAISERTSGYDTDERRQGIIDFLGEALGHGHDLVTDLSGCFAAQKQSHKQGDDYCRHYLMCDICNMNRFRLLKGIFYLAFRKGRDDFFSVTITPKEPVQGLNGCYGVFASLEKELAKKWGSFLGSREIKSTRPNTDGHTLWPHIHIIATDRKPSRPRRVNPFRKAAAPKSRLEFGYKETKIELEEIEKYLWHHSKCLPLSWFPKKVDTEGFQLVDLTCFELTESQRADINMFVDRERYLLSDLKMGMGIFHGIFDFKIFDSPLLTLLRSERFERQFVKYAATVKERADFTKVISFFYLVLCHGWSKGKVKRVLRIKTDSDRKYLDDKVKKHEVKAIEVLHWTNFYEWEPPQNLTQKKQSILDLAITEIDQGKIRSKAPVGKERLREILKELNLNTREKRLFAKVSTEKNRSNGKNHHK